MAATKSGDFKIKLALGDVDVSKMYLGDVKVYSAGNTVTYYVDTNKYFVEEWDSESDVLSPKTFVPSKSGWTFVGWRQDTSASESVLKQKVMDDEPIVLYAVFTQNVTVTYYNNSKTPGKWTGKRYYNNGNVDNPTVTLTQSAVSGWAERGWSTGVAGNDDIFYKNATSYKVWENVTVYGTYYKSVTLSYNGNNATSGSTSSQSGTAYRNYAGTVIGVTFTLRNNGYSRTNYTFTGWNLGTVGENVTISENTIAYAQWKGNPFYIGKGLEYEFTDFAWTNSKPNGSGGSYDEYVNAKKVYLSAEKTGGNDAHNMYTAAINTRGCNYMRVKYACYCDQDKTNQAYICGQEVGYADLASPKYVYIPISGNSLNFTAKVVSPASSPGSKSLHILEIYIYNA